MGVPRNYCTPPDKYLEVVPMPGEKHLPKELGLLPCPKIYCFGGSSQDNVLEGQNERLGPPSSVPSA